MILPEDVAWVVQSGHYTIHAQQKADVSNRVGVVHGLAVYGENQGALLGFGGGRDAGTRRNHRDGHY